MRTFIAVEIPKNIQNEIGNYVSSIKGLFDNVKWVSPENLHLTIKFLGEVNESDLKNINDCIAKTVLDFSPFTMGFSNIDFFPSRSNPRVIWIGTDGGEHNLLDIFQEFENCLENIGFNRETRTFSSHLTIGRVKRYKRITVPKDLKEFELVKFNVKKIALIKSTLTPSGPIYEKLFEEELKRISLSDLSESKAY